ncbi:DUF559 domain-containing protein [Pontibacter sp. BT310]|uniref:DUF559 domain-containing protein n=1 Tax=Pontibacter populi TaxID=890055 RepID=A0ABS6X7H5_9BACT|nr:MULTISPECIES: DUF559 domain-containing protein [Pontibacter]MBJ6116740.1 DUF559 domain-containing protein [Pontibacter sp. BT310]MBR0569164.1 DUF559 domain-containing protein [Microvirga sp. STS03]MBW3363594.1 DUF559 domain-containing protein [Pontibacter populi]
MEIHNRKYLKAKRQKLRGNLTPAEAELWKYLKDGKLDCRKFRRQHSIDNFIVDFYCPSENLVIELDGQVHNQPTINEADFERDKKLSELGLTVLRFENKEVFQNLQAVLHEISSNFSK